MYQWQADCLDSEGVLEGHSNLLVCAPTSAGKSLVGEVAMLRRVLQTGRAALLVLPFRALCAEKATHLERLLQPTGKEVQRCYGQAKGGSTLKKDTAVMVCTVEKANIIVNRMMEERTLNELCCVVVDEVHMLADAQRGGILESLCTKILFHAGPESLIGDADMRSPESSAGEGIQVIAMSATIAQDSALKLATWLHARLYTTDFRPVPLTMHLKVGRELRAANGRVTRTLECPADWEKRDPDLIAWLAKETVTAGHSVLVFCATKRACEAVASMIAQLVDVPERRDVPQSSMDSQRRSQDRARITRADALAELQRMPGQVRSALREVMARGTAFHHADLSSDERELVERAYKAGAISVLTATSTVAAGVNLPARRVICQPYMGLKDNVLEAAKWRQMAGRAGRAGLDTHGEAILLATSGVPLHKLEPLLQEDMAALGSRLQHDLGGMKRTMLEAVATGAVVTPDDVHRYASATLLAATQNFEAVAQSAITALKWLVERKLLLWDNKARAYEAMLLGKACLASGMDPEQTLMVHQDLVRARESFNFETELHLVFLITPVEEDLAPEHMAFCRNLSHLPKNAANVAEKVGLSQGLVAKLSMASRVRQGGQGGRGPESNDERVARRFYSALVLHDLIQEVPSDELQAKYGVKQGPLHQLQERAGPFAAMVAAFCHKVGWFMFEDLITRLQARVWFGVRQDIVALTDIPHVKGRRARLLYDADLRTPKAIHQASVDTVAAALLKGSSSTTPRDERMIRAAAGKIKAGARAMLEAQGRESKAEAAAIKALLAASSSASQATQAQGTPVQEGNEQPAVTSPHKAKPAMMSPRPNTKLIEAPTQLGLPPKAQQLKGVTVVQSAEAVTAFTSTWSQQKQWAFSISTRPAARPASANNASLHLPPHPDSLNLEDTERAKSSEHASTSASAEGIAVTWNDDFIAYLPLSSVTWSFIAPVLHSRSCKKVTYNLKPQLAALRCTFGSAGYIVQPCLDVRIMAWLVKPDNCSVVGDDDTRQLPKGAVKHTAEGLMEAITSRTALTHAKGLLKQIKAPLKRRLYELEMLAYKAAGENFCMGSSKEVSQILFEKLKLPVPPSAHTTSSKSGYWSTGKQVLEDLASEHDLPKMIIEHRQIEKRLAGFVEFEQQDQRRLPHDPPDLIRIGGVICQTETATGRLAMNCVNLQNVPKSTDFEVPSTQLMPSQEPGLQHRVHSANIRSAFVAPAGYVLLSADYCQLELRLMAHFSQDADLVAVLSDPHQDPFTHLAHTWLRAPILQVTLEQRTQAKRLAYGLLYGMGSMALSKDLGCDPKTAEELSAQFIASLPGVDAWLQKVRESCRQLGYVQTLNGRRRYLPHISGGPRGDAKAAERQAVNTVCQGSAADLVKDAMIALHATLEQCSAGGANLKAERAKLLVQIHDELLFEVPIRQLQETAVKIRGCMEGAATLRVPLRVKLHVGPSWGDLKVYTG
ncbi:hypothetical protein WJX73_010627 [Symbiochloris irregularis]|uniref:DNA-directed DNA polymerase n=1 Tax=Symbiochloris irregularis TaxID=706552 RepID=A0AAW1NPR4_9CHLO